MPKFVFQGVRPYLDAANAETHKLPEGVASRASTLGPVGRAQTALGQVGNGFGGAHPADCLAAAEECRLTLLLAADAVGRAIDDVAAAHGLKPAGPEPEGD